jgi:hypothetical protein
LIVGGNFSDWAARMFLRTTRPRRLSDSREMLEILADDRSSKDPGLVTFLANFNPRTKIFIPAPKRSSKRCRSNAASVSAMMAALSKHFGYRRRRICRRGRSLSATRARIWPRCGR